MADHIKYIEMDDDQLQIVLAALCLYGMIQATVAHDEQLRDQAEKLAAIMAGALAAKAPDLKAGATKFMIDEGLLVRIDSLLSLLRHRHPSTMQSIGEYEEVIHLSGAVRKLTEGRE